MNSIGKIQASLASATQETTLALANANFDFSLIKFEAPAEYKELGLALAEKKRSEAEAGSAHVTARRLGSLFHTMLPETPNLIRAYGTRASEIAKSPAVNPRGTEEYGPIRDYVGVDGTSIWAAATSGSAAIAAHLLACLIACCWRADEATAIWLEIVSERKRRLEEKTSSADYFDLTEAISSKLTLEKDQLANWDASARAWLAAADDAPVIRSRQKSVRGLLNHLNASVNSRQDLYTSVTEAWKLSLETLENVITGTSYSIQDGAVVVALVAWHLYPDLIILGPQIQDIKQNDVLIESGGVVTIGLATPIAVEDTSRGSGVHWSLSLGHLRYYGTTRTTSRSLASTPSGNSRFTFTEFVLIFLGAMIGLWSENETVSLESALSFIELAVTKFEETITASYEASIAQGMLKGSWIRILKDAIGLCNDRLPAKREEIRKLVHLGLRRPGFATIMHTRFDPTVTPRYRLFGLDTLMFVEALHETADQDMFLEKSIQQFMAKRPHAPAPAGPVKNHFLLLVGERGAEWVELLFYSKITPPDLERSKTGYDKIKEIRSDGGYLIHTPLESVDISNDEPLATRLYWYKPPKAIKSLLRRNGVVKDENDRQQPCYSFFKIAQTHQYSIFTPFYRHSPSVSGVPQSRAEIEHCLRTKTLDARGLLRLMRASEFFSFLPLLSAGTDLYTNLPGATISPGIVGTKALHHVFAQNMTRAPLPRSKTPQHLERTFDCRLSRGRTFRLLVLLETGHDLGPLFSSTPGQPASDWDGVLAVSTENTLYIDSTIMGNPTSRSSSLNDLRRVRGNVGRPGLTLIGWFSRVSGVECRQSDLAKWQIVNHNQFDGRLEDHFTSTSLHLRFTGYTREIDFGAHNKISNGSFVEAVVSAYDSGDWLGDVNILRALSSSWLKFVVPLNGCTGDAVGKAPERELVTVENWEELLSPHPSLPGVIKCYGNWQARLTAVSICVQRGYHTFLFDNHGCWRCAFEQLDFLTQQWTPQDLETPSDSEKTSTGPESDTDDDIDDAGLDREHAANKADDGGNHAGPISPSTERHMPLSNDDKSCHDDDESSSSSDDEEPCGPVRPFPPPPPGIRKVHTIFIL